MKLTNNEKIVGGGLILAPWVIIISSCYFNVKILPMIVLAGILFIICMRTKNKTSLSIFKSIFILIGYVIYLGAVFFVGYDPNTNPLYALPFAKRCSPIYNSQVLYRVDKDQKKVIFTPRSDSFWEKHKDDGIADKIRTFQAMPMHDLSLAAETQEWNNSSEK